MVKKLAENLKELSTEQARKDNRTKVLGDIAQMLERKNISLDEIGNIKRVSLYQSLTKNEQGEAEVHDLVALQFSPAFEGVTRSAKPGSPVCPDCKRIYESLKKG